jgi:hypothetical protein
VTNKGTHSTSPHFSKRRLSRALLLRMYSTCSL